jgi:outer membrane lipoprotein SlyB
MNRRTAWAILWLGIVLCGCATTPRLAPVRSGESVAIVVTRSPQADGVTRIRNQALGNDMSTGIGSGMVVGGLWGLSCGPFAPLCVPLGAAAGAITGTVAGAAVGMTGALSDDKSAQLRDRLNRAQQSHDLLEELRANVTERAHKHWTLSTDPSATTVTVELQDILLTSTRDEHIGFVLHVLVIVRPSSAQQPNSAKQKRYEYVGPFSSLTVWLDERSDFLDTSFTAALQQIATQIVSELAVN